MVSAAKHPNVKLFSYAQVEEIAGVTGNFSATIREKARYVDPSKCTGCELCVSKCPVDVPSEFNRYIGTRKAIYVPFPQAVPKVTLIDKDHCIQCKSCSKACQAGAINYDMQDKLTTVNVGAVIIATGWDEFPIADHPLYGYGKYPDVITQIELERMLSPVGPTEGHPYRPSDGKLPKKYVMIQCVGSRDMKTNEWCSGVCCMVAMKNAQLLKQEYPEAEITILYMDIRATDKGNEEYYRRIRKAGVTFLHGRPADVKRDSKTGQLQVIYENTNTDAILAEPADMVVLSTGIIPSKGTDQITGVLGLERGPGGFLKEIHGCLKPQYTKQAGVYICGCASGPKNIPYSVSSALAAAGNAASLINAGRFELELITPVVNEVKCVGCHRCERSCPFNAVQINERNIAVIDETACKGCGVCVSSCPARAIELRYYRKRQLEDQIEGSLRDVIVVPGQIARPLSKEAGS